MHGAHTGCPRKYAVSLTSSLVFDCHRDIFNFWYTLMAIDNKSRNMPIILIPCSLRHRIITRLFFPFRRYVIAGIYFCNLCRHNTRINCYRNIYRRMLQTMYLWATVVSPDSILVMSNWTETGKNLRKIRNLRILEHLWYVRYYREYFWNRWLKLGAALHSS